MYLQDHPEEILCRMRRRQKRKGLPEKWSHLELEQSLTLTITHDLGVHDGVCVP